MYKMSSEATLRLLLFKSKSDFSMEKLLIIVKYVTL